MVRWLLGAWPVVALACGRIGFDGAAPGDGAAGDGPGPGADGPGGDGPALGHDEDGDLVPDAIDVCPHVPDADQLDTDGDGVGDACDPRPDVPGEQLVLFATFEDDEPPIEIEGGGGAWTIEGDALRYAGTGFMYLFADLELGTRGIVAVGADLMGTTGAVHQISIMVRTRGVAPYGYVELYSMSGVHYVASSYYNGASHQPLMMTALPQGIPTGAITLSHEVRPEGGQRRSSIVGAWTSTYQASAVVPLTAPTNELEINARGFDLAIRYVVAIRSD